MVGGGRIARRRLAALIVLLWSSASRSGPTTTIRVANGLRNSLFVTHAPGDGGWTTVPPNTGPDPFNNAQNITDKPLGKVLRIDVNGDDFPEDATRNYVVPPDLAGVGPALPIRSTDIDRSDATTPADLLEEIDLLLSVGTYDPFDGASLP
jgi:hypothetical protein